ncbi:MAG: single-stranded DNA-binding protein [Candidatus Taylorbacteria bacterium RIFCSPLOWO2_02_FULL_43_11]|uniref:Single-stranded DNA-binding protein n=1 Tax=Candidatus Taylorbacteria bacterium RIFCSPHIGHO2_02_FULL_43_32b TaxID=1802306 RepID=A0A1G2MIG9_9BACT|nr:MAG: single-stranded DNA-binding protein [Candidatus Taylorbacteria bacterium RIFCSPHIGHO2_01_FULL_43_47]OHA22792.1 MAG: single-stranded DNA-binding protein [Candidatus Taylorbacteria bacterium RIFCSPHIGHO2_02_FULL_43_32b]OHA30848.1 MAG: single-stranded DNA-binding protein [Candidatus Taylorbacteria bacterium RIFCSPLOWO2_01_FULL_43_44]OHA35244.1 MAG: single-stranded DNA-binding protein [Candidatus Taylorbacteria bacterium RIFCSPLOWO2_02_FULL_43_11]
MYINKAILYGNLTRDPEIRALPSGIQVASFGIATNRVYKDKNGAKQESTDFHNIVVFGRQAETAAQYLKKGQGVFIEGRIQTRSWDDKDGQKKYRTEIVADRVQFGPKTTPGGNYSGGQSATEKPAPVSKPKDKEEGAIEYPQEEINPEDIPF